MERVKPVLRRTLFWDVSFDGIDYESNARFVIGRVLGRGNFDDWKELCRYYGLDRIRDEALQLRYMDKITLSFCKTIFDIPEERFRCCNTDPSIKKLWNY
jgi:hypothetical protein